METVFCKSFLWLVEEAAKLYRKLNKTGWLIGLLDTFYEFIKAFVELRLHSKLKTWEVFDELQIDYLKNEGFFLENLALKSVGLENTKMKK